MNPMKPALFACFWLLALASSQQQQRAPIIKLQQGELEGIVSRSRNGAEFYAYWGIPYANSPKRFQTPEPATVPGWEGTRDATEPPPVCLQIGFYDRVVSGSEDCLYANVFTGDIPRAGDKLKPVIVYIHPGGFMWLSANMFGPEYFMDEPVVLVTFNYRLGSLGFLNLAGVDGSSSVATGNMGLKDQVEFLKWVQQNIVAFGGHPEQVTIFGTSAGAASVTYHMLSPLSDGLFKHAIAASGSPLNSWAFTPNPGFYAKELGKVLNCSKTMVAKELLQCLLTRDAEEIIAHNWMTPTVGWPLDPITPFGPTIDGDFLPDHPEELLRQGMFQRVPYMTGVTKNEGLLLHAADILEKPELIRELNENWEAVAPTTLSLRGNLPDSALNAASKEIRTFYFGSENAPIGGDGEEALEQLYSDRFFIHGVRSTALHLTRAGTPVYPYIFDYAGSDSGFKNLYEQSDYSGRVLHADDTLYGFSGTIFGQELSPNHTDAADHEFSRRYIKLLLSFGGTHALARWPKTSREEEAGKVPVQWFHLDKAPSLQGESRRFTERMQFWDKLFRKYGESLAHDEL